MSDLEATAALLAAEHPGETRFDDLSFLTWLYADNPRGSAVQQSIDRGGRRVAHLALVPQEWWNDGGTALMCVGVNAVTSADAGRAHFLALLRRCLREMIGLGGAAGFGVTNEASTLITVARSGIGVHGPLPVRVRPVGPGGRDTQTRVVTPEWLASREFADLAARVDQESTPGWAQHWEPETLRWRLGSPAASYRFHFDDQVAAVTTRLAHRGVPLTVVMKLLTLGPGRVRRDAGPVVAHATRGDRAPAAVYAGFNDRVRLAGIPVPRPVLPAPLNLLVFGADRAAGVVGVPKHDRVLRDDQLELATFEFLDFDVL
jgi:hypothetical protein